MKKITPLFVLLVLTIVVSACGPAATTTPIALGTLETSTAEIPAETATAELPTSTESIDELIAMVNGFVASGEITGQAENGLLAKLDPIKQKVTNGQISAAANEMGAFINEVQAQSGKKITTAAGTALIANAQAVINELMARAPVTGGDGTVIPVAALLPDTTVRKTVKPIPMGVQLKRQTQWDAIALQVVKSVGFSTFAYDVFQLRVNARWEDTLAYYKTQAATAGWGDAPSQINVIAVGNYAEWSVTGSNGPTNYFAIAQIDTSNGRYTLNIFGSK